MKNIVMLLFLSVTICINASDLMELEKIKPGMKGIGYTVVENSNIETSKIIVLYAIIKNDRLFFEFMNEVYKEKLLLRDLFIRDKDFNMFFQSKRQQSERVDSWTEYTFKKLKQVYIRILFECGLIENQRGDRKIRIPILESEVKEYIYKIGDKVYINAIVGEND